MRSNYIPESELTPTQIQAGRTDGTLRPWKHDARGVLFYQQTPAIHGVPKSIEEVAAADEDEDESPVEEADDDRNLRLYHRLVELRAKGQDIDPELGGDVLEATGKSMDEFNFDVAELQTILAELGEI